jgi:hypothetical protein
VSGSASVCGEGTDGEKKQERSAPKREGTTWAGAFSVTGVFCRELLRGGDTGHFGAFLYREEEL